jgi:MIP family channel proteins
VADDTVTAGDAGTTAAAARIPDRGPAAYVAEFIGTFTLVFVIVAAVVFYVPVPIEAGPTGAPVSQPFQDFAVIGLVHLLVLFFLIQTLGIMSGAHFNPAVTVAMTVVRQIKPIDSVIYVLMQLAGATLGALVVKLLYDQVDNADTFGAVGFNEDRLDTTLQGMGIEALGTFFLVWVIVGVAVNPRATTEWAALAIGAALGMGVMVLAPLTGAGFNPARSFGPAIVSGEWSGGAADFLLVYVAAPVLGAVIAGFLYFNLAIAPGKKGVGGAEPVG